MLGVLVIGLALGALSGFAQIQPQPIPLGSKEADAQRIQTEESAFSETTQLLWLGGILSGGMLLLGMSLYQHIRQAGRISQDVIRQLRSQREQLVRQLADIDEQYVQKIISQQDYMPERQRRKQELMEMTLVCETLSSRNL